MCRGWVGLGAGHEVVVELVLFVLVSIYKHSISWKTRAWGIPDPWFDAIIASVYVNLHVKRYNTADTIHYLVSNEHSCPLASCPTSRYYPSSLIRYQGGGSRAETMNGTTPTTTTTTVVNSKYLLL